MCRRVSGEITFVGKCFATVLTRKNRCGLMRFLQLQVSLKVRHADRITEPLHVEYVHVVAGSIELSGFYHIIGTGMHSLSAGLKCFRRSFSERTSGRQITCFFQLEEKPTQKIWRDVQSILFVDTRTPRVVMRKGTVSTIYFFRSQFIEKRAKFTF